MYPRFWKVQLGCEAFSQRDAAAVPTPTSTFIELVPSWAKGHHQHAPGTCSNSVLHTKVPRGVHYAH